jgi:hypothetical protein
LGIRLFYRTRPENHRKIEHSTGLEGPQKQPLRVSWKIQIRESKEEYLEIVEAHSSMPDPKKSGRKSPSGSSLGEDLEKLSPKCTKEPTPPPGLADDGNEWCSSSNFSAVDFFPRR